MPDYGSRIRTELEIAADQLVEISRGVDELGPMQALQCVEAEAWAAVVRAAGEPELAKRLIELHSSGDDDQGDQHHDQYDCIDRECSIHYPEEEQ